LYISQVMKRNYIANVLFDKFYLIRIENSIDI